ncbi:hypothetical protein B0H11DRAFT_1924271 [Mycena galericulata]|nr:hypothetical protein B0H11DRAFT_1924271 [Mycena galericulata]
MAPLTLDDLGKCNNSNCKSGCGAFYCATLDPRKVLQITECDICHCVGAQHIVPQELRPAPSAAPTPPTPAERPATTAPTAPKVSATAETLNNSRSSSEGGFFRGLASKRSANIQASLPPRPGMDFHPAKQSQVEGDLNPYNSKAKKRERHGKSKNTHAEPNAKLPPKVKKRRDITYTVMLVEGTKAVARGTYIKPDSTKLNDLADEGYMQKVSIPDDATSVEIDKAIQTVFSHVDEVATHGFRLLRVKSILKKNGQVKKGVAHRLRPLKGRKELNVMNWQRSLANTSVRGAGRGFKSLVFIAINPEGPNLGLGRKVVDAHDSCVEDIPSSGSSVSESGPEDSDTGTGDAGDSGGDERPAKKPKKDSEPSFGGNGGDGVLSGNRSAKGKSSEDVDMVSDDTLTRPGKGKGKAGPSKADALPDKGKAKARVSEDVTMASDEEFGGHSGDTGGRDEIPKTDFKGKKKAQGKPDEHQSHFRFHDDPDPDRAPVSSEHLQLRRLLQNMAKPTKSATWVSQLPVAEARLLTYITTVA